jgi:hypothetical protein
VTVHLDYDDSVDAITFALLRRSDGSWTVMVGASGSGCQYQNGATPTADETERFFRLGALMEWPREDDGQYVDADDMMHRILKRDYVLQNPDAVQLFHRVDVTLRPTQTKHRFIEETDSVKGDGTLQKTFHFDTESSGDISSTSAAYCALMVVNPVTYNYGSLEDRVFDGLPNREVLSRMIDLLSSGRKLPEGVIDTDWKLENVPPGEGDVFDIGGFQPIALDPHMSRQYTSPISGKTGGQVTLSAEEGGVFKGETLPPDQHCAMALVIMLKSTTRVTQSTTNDGDFSYAVVWLLVEVVTKYASMHEMGTISQDYAREVVAELVNDRVSERCELFDRKLPKIVNDYDKNSFLDLITAWPTLAIVLLVDALLLKCTKTCPQLKELLQIICSKFCSFYNKVSSQILFSALATGHYGRVKHAEDGRVSNACDSNGGFCVELPSQLLNLQQQIVNAVLENPQAVQIQTTVMLKASMHKYPVGMHDPKYHVQNKLIGFNVTNRDGKECCEFSPTTAEEQGLTLLALEGVVTQQQSNSQARLVAYTMLLAALLRRDVGQSNELVLQRDDQPHAVLQQFWQTIDVSPRMQIFVKTVGSIIRNAESGKLGNDMISFISNESEGATAGLDAPFQRLIRRALGMFNRADFCKDDDPFYLHTEAYINFIGKLINRMLGLLQRLDLKRPRQSESDSDTE